jgi:hypothetical protein
MREELGAAHDAVMVHLQELESLLMRTTIARADLANMRWRLSRASKQRLGLLERRIYPYLLGLVSGVEAQAIRQLQAGARPLLTQTVNHVGTWTIDRIMSDLVGYRCASAAMRATMRARITAERDILYPLLTRYRGKMSANPLRSVPLESAAQGSIG